LAPRRYVVAMSNHHRGRRTTAPRPAPVEFAPPVTDPSRPAWVERAYAEIGYRLLEWQQEFGLTCAEFLLLMLRCGQDQLASIVRSERSGDPRVRQPGLGGPMNAEPKPEA
jgi:hypothetical protein